MNSTKEPQMLMREAKSGGGAQKGPTPLAPKGYLRAFHVLVAEPNMYMRSILRGLLSTFDAETITEVTSFAEVEYYATQMQVDLLMTEMFLHGGTAIDIAHNVRSASTALQFLPIVLVTGFTRQDYMERARDAGIDEIVAKPFTAANIIRRIENIVERRRPFVKTPSYFGPERRRKKMRFPLHLERRGSVLKADKSRDLTDQDIGDVVRVVGDAKSAFEQ
jgi:two-component system, chemotaxis family, chemotaxis protein CheY